MDRSDARSRLLSCHAAAVAGAEPRRALTAALNAQRPSDRPVYLIAAGKASVGMMEALLEWLAAHGREPAGGVGIGMEMTAAPHASVRWFAGDHPIPGAGSHRAAEALHQFVATIPAVADVHVALSGGASALIAGPLPGYAMRDVTAAFDVMLRSGLDIDAMNALRKRITRWSAGRLAIACQPSALAVWVVSDVPNDDPSTIGSGPCHADRWQRAEVTSLLDRTALRDRLPAPLHALFDRDTPPAAMIPAVVTNVIASNATARTAAAAAGATHGWVQRVDDEAIVGEAREVGRRIATEAIRTAREWHQQNAALRDEGHGDRVRPLLLVFGGETTVTMAGAAGRGGRCQELALAAAEILDVSPVPIMLLAAGTDGRDGPTDAAGAVVDERTWSAMQDAGIDGARALDAHDAYPALDAAGSLVRTGITGTNVMDLVLVLVTPDGTD